MKKLCVIGDPVAHSLSPLIHEHLIRRTGVSFHYETHTVKAQELVDFMAEAKGGAWVGCNVTMPHKQTILPLLEKCTPEAIACGAVNTVRFENGRAVGHNTDGQGFLDSLGFSPEGKRVLILGAGGAAEAVVSALVRAGAEVWLANRTAERAEHLANRYTNSVRTIPFTEKMLKRGAQQMDLLVNATPLGMAGNEIFPDFSFLESTHAVVCDLVYHPRETALLREARRQGLRTIEGTEMLIHQAIRAFTFFTGEEVDMLEMKRELQAMLPKE